ncbi:MAG: hypothetical protein JWQ87_321 [Candidatus Sulfotelmatobacter sp.]|nr:hypothetical protein [Candidatus Sulfotelmatobacter sp.]
MFRGKQRGICETKVPRFARDDNTIGEAYPIIEPAIEQGIEATVEPAILPRTAIAGSMRLQGSLFVITLHLCGRFRMRH